MTLYGLWFLYGGFAVFCVGGACRVYMDFAVNGWAFLRTLRRVSTVKGYEHLMETAKASPWPLLVSRVCIPLGIAFVFGAILWTTNSRPK
jgi:hypothetical protein